jgi:hypothetical protein
MSNDIRSIIVKKFFFLVTLYLAVWSVKANSIPTAITQSEQGLYAAPEWTQAIVGHLNVGTSLAIEGRDETGVWLLVDTPENLRGWVATTSNKLQNDINLYTLPILSDIIPFDTSVIKTTPLTSNPDTQRVIERLRSTPIFYNFDTPEVHAIFQHGQQLGQNANVFAKIGDSNTTSGDFLYPMGLSNQCDLGPFNYLQDTINYFSVPVQNSDKNPFTHSSVAAQKGLSSSGVLDPMWAGTECLGSENPATCEYRLLKPSISLITIGLMDVRYKNPPDLFRSNIERLVQTSIEQGIIPVLTNIVVMPDQTTLSFDVAMQTDNALLDVADQYQIPLINLWRAAQPLPNFGIGPDHTHMRHVVGSFCNFTGAEQTIGGTLRNLLTLESLDELRRNVLLQ